MDAHIAFDASTLFLLKYGMTHQYHCAAGEAEPPDLLRDRDHVHRHIEEELKTYEIRNPDRGIPTLGDGKVKTGTITARLPYLRKGDMIVFGLPDERVNFVCPIFLATILMIFRNRWNQIWMRVRWWKNEGNLANFYGRFYECQEDEVPDENFYLGNAAESQGHLIHWGKKDAVLTKGSGKIRAEVLKLCKFDERLAASGYSYDPKFGEKDFQNLKPKLIDDDSSDSSDSSSDDGS